MAENNPVANLADYIPRAGYEPLLDSIGYDNVVIHRIPADASFRRYFRIQRGDDNIVLMDAPPEHENVAAFTRVARHLGDMGFSAPKIIAEDTANGFLLLEDLGDDTFTRVLADSKRDSATEKTLYQIAVDTLAEMHKQTSALPGWLEHYSPQKLLAEAMLLVDWFMPGIGLDAPTGKARSNLENAWLDAFGKITGSDALVLRDFHVDNLVKLARPGVQACGLLDFQDALKGHAAYDLMSLLEDARRDIDAGMKNEMLAHYHAAAGTTDEQGFADAFAILGAGRHAKVIGIFTRLAVRDNKPGYLGHIPRVWRLLEGSLAHPLLAEVKNWVDENIPQQKRVIPEIAGKQK